LKLKTIFLDIFPNIDYSNFNSLFRI